MGRGFLSGVISGTCVGAVILALLSLLAPLPKVVQPVVTNPVSQEAEETSAEAEEAASEPASETDAPDEAPQDGAEDVTEPAAQQEEAPQEDATPATEETKDDTATEPAEEAQPEEPDTQDDASLESDGTADQSLDDVAQDADATSQQAQTTAEGAETEQELASRLAAMLADIPVDVSDAAPETPQSPNSSEDLLETLTELAPDPAAPAALATNDSFSDVSIFNVPSSSADTASIDTSQPEFELPEVLEFDPEPPEFNEAVTAPNLEVEIVPGTAASRPATEPTTQRETAPEIVSTPATPQPAGTKASEDPDALAEAEIAPQEDVVDEAIALINDSSVVTRRLPQTTDPLPSGSDAASITEEQPPAIDLLRNRLPSLGDTQPDADANVEDEPELLDPAEVGALRAFASPGPDPSDLPKVSIILLDAGNLGISTSEILSLKLPISIAVSTKMDGAVDAFRTFRTGGLEALVMIEDLPPRASPADVQVALEGYFQEYSETIGVLEPTDRRLQINRGLLEPVLDGLTPGGHALVTYEQGLRSAQQAAERREVPAASIFRVLDDELEGTPKIMRYLDRAAFAANQKGHVVVLGRTYRETVDAIKDWAEENKGDYDFVPVSTILLSEAG